MKILVTGASGLIGGRVIDALRANGTTEIRAASREARRWPEGISGVVLDWRSRVSMTDACDGMTAVINLAGMPESACAADPNGALTANAGGTLALVEASLAVGVPRFVQLSTVKVYGAAPTGVISEDTLTQPRSHYAITHRAAEDYAARHPQAVILRLSNGFGAPVASSPSSWSVIVNAFCHQAMATQRIVLQSDGRSWRNFAPMTDILAGIKAGVSSLPAGTYNLASAQSETLRAMAERVARVSAIRFGTEVEISLGSPAGGLTVAGVEFRTDRLIASGVILDASADDEIERTLQSARAALGHS
jgi:UDP-glucose 4-epimerase